MAPLWVLRPTSRHLQAAAPAAAAARLSAPRGPWPWAESQYVAPVRVVCARQLPLESSELV